MIRSAGHAYLRIGVTVMIPFSAGIMAGWLPPMAIAQSVPSVLSTPPSASQTMTILYVNPVSGNDTTADGSDRAPFKTVTRALEVAPTNATIQLAPGVYNASTGEIFPIALKPHVTIQGDADSRGQDVVIYGGGTFSSPSLAQQNITILAGANHSKLIGVTLTNPNGYGMLVESSHPAIASNTIVNNARGGIIVVGKSNSLIQNNFFYQNGDSNVWIQGSGQPAIQQNVIEQSQIGIAIGDAASPVLIENRITQNKIGIRVQGTARPTLRRNSVEGNAQFGLQAIAQAQPDLGKPGDADANFFRNNGSQDIAVQSQPKPQASVNSSPQPESQETQPSVPIAVPSPAPTSSKPEKPVAPPPSKPGVVVVPTVPISSSQPVPAIELGDRVPPVSQPASSPPVTEAAPLKPAPTLASPRQSLVPQPVRQTSIPSSPVPSSSGITSTSFPTPSGLINSNPATIAPRPMRVLQLNLEASSEPSELPSTQPLATVPIPVKPPRSTTPIVQPVATPASSFPQPSSSNLPAPIPTRTGIVDEIPSPPVVAPHSVGMPSLVPIPAVIPAQRPPASTLLAPNQLAQPTIAPVRQPVQAPILILPTPIATPPSRSIPISVPPPESNPLAPMLINPQKRQPSPVALPPLAKQSTAPNPGTLLLPVPGPDIPVGNVGNMPSVYSTREGGQGMPTVIGTPGGSSVTGSVVVKYRVVVVATDEIQREQVRTIIPDAFPIVYHGQQVMQAGAFGDRNKAEQLVASLGSQGLQAIVEPLK